MREVTIIPKTWGEERIVVRKRYAGKFLVYQPNTRSSLHYHCHKDETFYVLKGFGELELQNEDQMQTHELSEGDIIDIEYYCAHRVTAGPEGLTIIEFSSTDDPNDIVRLEPSRA